MATMNSYRGALARFFERTNRRRQQSPTRSGMKCSGLSRLDPDKNLRCHEFCLYRETFMDSVGMYENRDLCAALAMLYGMELIAISRSVFREMMRTLRFCASLVVWRRIW